MMMNMFADSLILAQAVQQPGGLMDSLVLIVPMVLIFYFLIIRPQKKRMDEHRNMVSAVERNDVVVTGGGLIGKVTKVKDDNEVEIELAEGLRVKAVKSTLADVRVKAKPAKSDS